MSRSLSIQFEAMGTKALTTRHQTSSDGKTTSLRIQVDWPGNIIDNNNQFKSFGQGIDHLVRGLGPRTRRIDHIHALVAEKSVAELGCQGGKVLLLEVPSSSG
jgi:hypothetical protein